MKPYTRSKAAFAAAMMLAVAGLGASGCGADEGSGPSLAIDLFGWGPGPSAATEWVTGLPAYPDAQNVRLKVTQPIDSRVLSTQTFAVDSRKGTLPDISFGENLRMDFEILNSQGAIIATGATPRFTFTQGIPLRTFRVMIAPTNTFSPVGSLVADQQTGASKLVQSRFDYRGSGDLERQWLGRIGHVAVPTSNGQVLIVGGAEPAAFHRAGATPSVRQTFADIQIFDPVTGYFTDLAHDDVARATNTTGIDRLRRSRAFHTVTPLGNDRFLVVGGMRMNDGDLRALNSIELIDLNAPGGTRIQELRSPDGTPPLLKQHRAFHTATLRTIDRKVVVAGGIGTGGMSDIVGTFELIDPDTGTISAAPGNLQAARADHAAVLSADGQSVWLIGGRNATDALASTEVLRAMAEGTESRASISLKRARYGMAAVRLSDTNGQMVLVAGGFTSLEGSATDTFEIGGISRDEFIERPSWKLNEARGGLSAIELPHSLDIVVLGGVSSTGEVVRSAERLRYEGLAEANPFTAELQGRYHQTRQGSTASLLPSGFILLTGGMDADGETALDSAEYFNPFDPVRATGASGG